MKTAIELIAEERQRQIDAEGYSAERNNRKRYRPHSCDPEKVARLEAIRMGRA